MGLEGQSGRRAAGVMDPLERARIEFLLARDGLRETRAWVERTRDIYRFALAGGAGHAGTPEYRRGFEASIATFERWLSELDDV